MRIICWFFGHSPEIAVEIPLSFPETAAVAENIEFTPLHAAGFIPVDIAGYRRCKRCHRFLGMA